MAGIYVHIPYCKVKCHYCDFHFSTNLSNKQALVDALIKEIILRKNYLLNEPIQTLYFGGGTPSVLTKEELQGILSHIKSEFNLSSNLEITVEANPDDLTLEKLQELKSLGVNRLSIGIQSFDDKNLVFLNRAHSHKQTVDCLNNAKKIGFDNITIDLIYGLPHTSLDDWKAEVTYFLSFGIPHLSAYCLTIEPNTVFGKRAKNGELSLPKDEVSLSQFNYLIETLTKAGYEHYEISNFSLLNFNSQHNSAYWKNKSYLGIGPSAHSYNGHSRSWNIANNIKYIQALSKGEAFFESENLSQTDCFNEYILTRIRTKWGISREELKAINAVNYARIEQEINSLIRDGLLVENGNVITLSAEGKFLSDHITSKLFIE